MLWAVGHRQAFLKAMAATGAIKPADNLQATIAKSRQLDRLLATPLPATKPGTKTMATDINGIGAMVRDAKAGLKSARASVERLKRGVGDLSDTVRQVDAMADEVEAAHAELKQEIHGVTNAPER